MKSRQICFECDKERERCRESTREVTGNVIWVCPQCWRDLEYDKFMYDYKLRRDDKNREL